MRIVFLSLSIFFLLITKANAQYSEADISILISIKEDCDGNDSLNWNVEVDPSEWNSLEWDLTLTPHRVKHINISNKGLSGAIRLDSLPDLIGLDCSSNYLEELIIGDHSVLEEIDCSSNSLSSLELGDLPVLKSLTCYNNILSALNINHLSALTYLNCYSNSISNLDVSDLTELVKLFCMSNKLTFSSLVTALELPKLTDYNYIPQKKIYESDTCTKGDVFNFKKEAIFDEDITTFTLFRDGVELISNTHGIFTLHWGGTIHCTMVNNKFPGLILTTNDVWVLDPDLFLWISTSDLVIQPEPYSSASFSITTNTEWEIVKSDSWLIAEPAKGSGGEEIIIHAEKNPLTTERTAFLTINGYAVNSLTVTVEQLGMSSVGIYDEIYESDAFVWPNPVLNYVSIRIPPNMGTVEARIYSVNGSLLSIDNITDTEIQLDMSNYKPGIYILELICPERIIIKSLIKE